MEIEDIEKVLKSDKFKHLTAETLVSYRDNQLDETALALANAHLRVCLLCEKQLDFLKGEQAALQNYEVTAKDRALIQRVLNRIRPERNARPFDDATATPRERLAVWLNELTTSWVAFYSLEMRGSDDGEEVFRFENAGLTIWGILETDVSMTIHFSSPDLAFEGARIRFRLGPFTEEITLQRRGDAEVAAKIHIARNQRARKMRDVSIEIVSMNSPPGGEEL